MLDYICRGGASRGSCLYTCPEGKLPGKDLPEIYRCCLAEGKLGDRIQEIGLKEKSCQTTWRNVRPLPEPDYFFETQWKLYRERNAD